MIHCFATLFVTFSWWTFLWFSKQFCTQHKICLIDTHVAFFKNVLFSVFYLLLGKFRAKLGSYEAKYWEKNLGLRILCWTFSNILLILLINLLHAFLLICITDLKSALNSAFFWYKLFFFLEYLFGVLLGLLGNFVGKLGSYEAKYWKLLFHNRS